MGHGELSVLPVGRRLHRCDHSPLQRLHCMKDNHLCLVQQHLALQLYCCTRHYHKGHLHIYYFYREDANIYSDERAERVCVRVSVCVRENYEIHALRRISFVQPITERLNQVYFSLDCINSVSVSKLGNSLTSDGLPWIQDKFNHSVQKLNRYLLFQRYIALLYIFNK